MSPAALLASYVLVAVAFGWPGVLLSLATVLWLEWPHRASTTGHGEAASTRPVAPEDLFLRATFLHLGYVCKVDGQVSPAEIATAEAVMQRLGLGPSRRQQAAAWFRAGKRGGDVLESGLAEWLAACDEQASLAVLFLELQLRAAHADGRPTARQREVLGLLAERLDLNPLELARVEAQVVASLRRQAGGSIADLTTAYQILGVPAGATDAELTQAYRRLLSRHHPDKLAARDLPQEMLALANEHTRQLRAAYQCIRKAREARRQ